MTPIRLCNTKVVIIKIGEGAQIFKAPQLGLYDDFLNKLRLSYTQSAVAGKIVESLLNLWYSRARSSLQISFTHEYWIAHQNYSQRKINFLNSIIYFSNPVNHGLASSDRLSRWFLLSWATNKQVWSLWMSLIPGCPEIVHSSPGLRQRNNFSGSSRVPTDPQVNRLFFRSSSLSFPWFQHYVPTFPTLWVPLSIGYSKSSRLHQFVFFHKWKHLF